METAKETLFERKIRPLLKYVGTIGAILTSIAYIVIVFVLIRGFKVQSTIQTITFAIVNAAVGLLVVQFLKVQGIDWAKSLPENKAVIDKYYNTKTKDKKPRTIKYYWITSVLKDLFSKGCTLVLTTTGLIYIVIVGSNDWNLLLIAVVNLILFICFGLLSLVNAYDFYNTNQIPYMINKLDEAKTVKANCETKGTTKKAVKSS